MPTPAIPYFSRLFFAIFVLASSCQHKEVVLPPAGPAYVMESQLALAQASLKKAAKATEPMEVASHALFAAEIAWDLDWKNSGDLIKQENRKGARIYDAAVLRLLSLARDSADVIKQKGKEFHVPGARGDYLFTLDPRTFDALADYPTFKAAASFQKSGGFRHRFTRDGVGVPIVGINRDAPISATALLGGNDKMKRHEGYTAPRTAILIFDKPARAGQPRKVKIAIVDPRKYEKEPVGKRELVVAADFTAPLMMAYPDFGAVMTALRAAINPDTWLPSSGLYALERYDPERIPVILVHGLFSTPDMWKDLINTLNATPGIGSRYQFYVFTYPTGLAPAYTANMLRERMKAIHAQRPLDRGYVLIGHSMGGILSRMQITNPGLTIWNQAFGQKAETVYKHSSPDDVIWRSLIFEADPKVRRAIYICVPHRGSPVATTTFVQYLARLARSPIELTNSLATSPLRALGLLPAKLQTSADGLSPQSPILRALDTLPATAPTHSIIGNRGRPGPLEQSSDGIVPYWSSHQKSAESEKVIPTGHGGFDHPLAVEEVARILDLEGTKRFSLPRGNRQEFGSQKRSMTVTPAP